MSNGGALRQVAAEFGFTFDTAALARGDQAIGGVIGRVGALGTALAAGSGIAAVMVFADGFAHQAEEVRNASTELGITTDQLQAMRLGFADAGVSGDELTGAMRRLNRSIGAAGHGGKQQGQALAALGVRARGAHGELGTLGDLLPSIMDGFQRITNPTEAAQRATQLFGRAGGRLVPILQRGRAGLAAMNAELARLGGGISQRAIESAHRYEEAQHRLDVVTVGLKASVAEGLLPVIQRVIERGAEFVAAFHRMTDGTHIVQHTLEILGGVALAVGAQMLLPWVPLIAAVVGAVLVWDELRGTMEGTDSLLRRFVERQYGLGRADKLTRALNETWGALGATMRELPGDFRVLKDSAIETFTTVYDWIERVLPGFRELRWAVEHAGQIAHAVGAIAHSPVGAGIAQSIIPGGRAFSALAGRLAAPNAAESTGQLVTHHGVTTAVGGVQEGPATAQAPLITALGHLAAVTRPNVVTHGPTTINVHGATDPQATAAEVRRQLDERDRRRANDNDADHPVPAVQ